MEYVIISQNLLADVMKNAMIYRGEVIDLDTCTEWGVYYTTANSICANPPAPVPIHWRYAIVEVLKRASTSLQRLWANGRCFYRYHDSNNPGVWGNWYELTSTPI